MRILTTLLLAMGLLVACGDDDGSGACEKSYTGNDYCLNFKDTSDRTGEEICTDQSGSWTAGESCEDLGYTDECSTGSFVKPSGSCP